MRHVQIRSRFHHRLIRMALKVRQDIGHPHQPVNTRAEVRVFRCRIFGFFIAAPGGGTAIEIDKVLVQGFLR